MGMRTVEMNINCWINIQRMDQITPSVRLSLLQVHAARVQVITLDIQQLSTHEHTRPANTQGNSTLRYVQTNSLEPGGICTTGWPKEGQPDNKVD